MHSYIICSTGRSGSSLLCEALRATNVAGLPYESMPRSPFEFSKQAILNYVKKHSTPNGVFSAKAMWWQWLEFNQLIRRKLAVSEIWPNLRYVQIKRHDKIAQAVSNAIAEQTKRWNSNAPKNNIQPIYNSKQISKCLQTIQDSEAAWTEYITNAGQVPYVVYYEDLVQDYEGTALKILDFLEIPRPETITWQRKLKRQADEKSQNWIERYREFERGR